MDEILRHLSPGASVLDLGSLTGSFRAEAYPAVRVVRLDLEVPGAGAHDRFVQADAARLPFPDHSFDVVIANHSLEHIQRLPETLQEMGRVVRPEGNLYVAVPDASSFSDRLFRWVYRGGGHINPFLSADALAQEITRVTSLKLTAARPLFSSFEYLNRYYFPARSPWRLWLLGNGNRQCIVVLSYAVRLFDRLFHTRAGAYGWALYFGHLAERIDTSAWRNVCVGCGAGFSVAWLVKNKYVRSHYRIFRSYNCPYCTSWNFFTPDS